VTLARCNYERRPAALALQVEAGTDLNLQDKVSTCTVFVIRQSVASMSAVLPFLSCMLKSAPVPISACTVAV
jgi:hypothetical protein